MSAEKAQNQGSGAQPGTSERLRSYYDSLAYEWKKITFPDRKQLWQSVLVVFIFCIFLMAVVSIYDIAVGFVFKTFFLPAPTGV